MFGRLKSVKNSLINAACGSQLTSLLGNSIFRDSNSPAKSAFVASVGAETVTTLTDPNLETIDQTFTSAVAGSYLTAALANVVSENFNMPANIALAFTSAAISLTLLTVAKLLDTVHSDRPRPR